MKKHSRKFIRVSRIYFLLSSLCLWSFEVISNTTVHHFQVAAATSTSRSALYGLNRPVVAPTASAGVGASSAPLPLNVVGVSTTATAQNVSSPVACTLGGGTFRHLKAAGKLGLVKYMNK